MSEPADFRTAAQTRRSRWPGWIWAMPIAAILVVGWLGVRHLAEGGERVVVSFDNAHGVTAGDTDVTYRGMKVGQVSGVSLTRNGPGVEFTLKLDRDMDQYLGRGTRFWLVGAQVDLSDPSTLKALIAGPHIAMEPGPGAPSHRFVGVVGEDQARGAPIGPRVPYIVRFDGAVGGLIKGSPVALRGFRVGTVTDASLAYDARTGALDTPVQIELEPALLHIEGVRPPANGDWRAIVDAMLSRLIASGLRARLTQDPPVIGGRQVTLDFVAGAPPAGLVRRDGMEEIPTSASGDIGSLTVKADQILTKVDALPIEQIGDNTRRITGRVRTLVNSPKIVDSLDHLDGSLNHLDRSLAQVDSTLHQVAPKISPLVDALRRTADDTDAAVATANQVIGGDPTRQNSDLPSVLHEMTRTARSIRTLADYLERHPEALIRGKAKTKAHP